MPRFKLVDNVRVQFTAEEEAARDAEIQIVRDNEFPVAMSRLRQERNNLLTETDWIVTRAIETDTSISDDWKTYRQELRDITNGLTTKAEVKAIVFPTKP